MCEEHTKIQKNVLYGCECSSVQGMGQDKVELGGVNFRGLGLSLLGNSALR